jgi:trehalose 6-phosphate phosphatase
MKALFSPHSLRHLQSLARNRTLFAFDFDGTLAQIRRRPSDARLNRTTESLLRTLSKSAPIAIISGRSVKDLRKTLTFHPDILIGSHGLESPQASQSSLQCARRTCKGWKQQLKRQLKGFPPCGIELEDKSYSLAFHYRRARNRRWARCRISDLISQLTPAPKQITGKCVINLMPAGALNKAEALLHLLNRSRWNAVIYVGDDDTDEDVFNLRDKRFFTVRVGAGSSSQAKYFIRKQSDIDRLLRIVITNRKQSVY